MSEFSLCAILTLTHDQTPVMVTLTMAAWTQAVLGSGYHGKVQLGLGKGRQEIIFDSHNLKKNYIYLYNSCVFFIRFEQKCHIGLVYITTFIYVMGID